MTVEEHEVLRRAAEASGQTITQYVLDRVLADAHDDLADRTVFRVAGPQFTEFRARLDRPADHNAALDKLLSRQTPWTVEELSSADSRLMRLDSERVMTSAEVQRALDAVSSFYRDVLTAIDEIVRNQLQQRQSTDAVDAQ